MRVLITGAAGFVGRHFAALCAEKDVAAVGLGRTPAQSADLPSELSEYHACDVTDQAQVRAYVAAAEPDLVVHLAGAASVNRSWLDPESAVRGNFTTTLSVLEAVRREAPAAQVLIASSSEIYGRVPADELPIREDRLLYPQNPYALGKAAADLAGGLYADAHGLHVIRARAFNHTGPGQAETYVVSSFAKQIALAEARGAVKITLRTGKLDVRRDLTDVRDVVRAYWALLTTKNVGIFNVCSGRARSMHEVLDGLASLTRVAVRQETDPTLVRPVEIAEMRGCAERLAQATGWRPSISFERTLHDTLEWWRSRVAI